MIPAALRSNEEESLASLRDLLVLDSAPEAEFQALVEVASTVCGVPISLISLIDSDRQWFKANVGLPGVSETPRESAFCAHAVLGSEIFEIPDATADPRFADNPLVAGRPDIRFYAGAPLVTQDGVRLGTLCVIDRERRHLDETQRAVLQKLAIAASRALEGRAATIKLKALSQKLVDRQRKLRLILDAVPSMMAYWDSSLCCRFANRAYETWFGVQPEALLGKHISELLGPDLFALNRPMLEAALRGERTDFERTVPGRDGVQRHSLAFYVPDVVDGNVVGILVQVTDVTRLKETEQALRREAAEHVRVNGLLKEAAQALQDAQRLGRIGSWEWNLVTDATTWSEELFRIAGRDPEAPPPPFAERLQRYLPESRERLAQAALLCQRDGLPYSLELEFLRSDDGERRWIDARGNAVRNPAGNIIAVRGTAQDITERRRTETALRKSQEFLERTGELAGVGGWEVDLSSGEITWSPAVCRIHGVQPGFHPTLDQAITFYEPASRPVIQAAVARAVETGESFDLELQIIRTDGVVRSVRSVGSAEMIDGVAARLSGAFQDVTDRRRLARELAEQHELLRVTLNSIGDAVITTDAAGMITWLNPVAERMTGWLNSEARGRPLRQVFHIVREESRETAPDPVAACLSQGAAVGLAHRSVLVSRDGVERGIEDSAAPIRSVAGDLLGVVLVFHDVSEQRWLSSEMTHRATHDALTGLINRAEFETRLQRTLDNAIESSSEHALLYIDLDQFKLVNDACGHAVGDKLLQQVSRLLEESVRGRDTLARLGGDEFAVILGHCSALQAQRAAQTICDRMDEFRFLHDDRRFRIGASIGLVPIDSRWVNTEAIKQAADASCYAAKEAGRNRFHAWFDTDDAIRTRHGEMQWTSRIERALDNDEFVLFAQRIQALQRPAKGLHAEVLLRLRDIDGSLIPPGAFLPAAERFHLATRIDRWVVARAVAWLHELPSVAEIDCLSVNLSGQSVGDRAFHAWAYAVLEGAGEAIRQRLCFEITETAAITNMADAASFVERVRASGVRIALDDFGAGASSFGYLKNLPVDYLKIDGQFVRDLVNDRLDEAAVRCFIDVAKTLGVQTVAEFVDQPALLARLSDMGADFAQGYLIHQPSPIEDLLSVPSTHATV